MDEAFFRASSLFDSQQYGCLKGAECSAGADRERSCGHGGVIRRLPQVVRVVLAERIPEAVHLWTKCAKSDVPSMRLATRHRKTVWNWAHTIGLYPRGLAQQEESMGRHFVPRTHLIAESLSWLDKPWTGAIEIEALTGDRMDEKSLFTKFWTDESKTTRTVLSSSSAASGLHHRWPGAFYSTSFTTAGRSRRTSGRWGRRSLRSTARAGTSRSSLLLRHVHPSQSADREEKKPTNHEHGHRDRDSQACMIEVCESALVNSVHHGDCIVPNAQQAHARHEA